MKLLLLPHSKRRYLIYHLPLSREHHVYRTISDLSSSLSYVPRLATSFGYYGLSLNASRLAGDKYLNFFISGVIELPAYLSGIWILSKWVVVPNAAYNTAPCISLNYS